MESRSGKKYYSPENCKMESKTKEREQKQDYIDGISLYKAGVWGHAQIARDSRKGGI